MTERIVTVVPEAGLHARPASKFVETANEYDCAFEVGAASDEDLVDARSMLAVTSLGVGHDEQVKLVAEGDDADAALDALEGVLSTPEEGDGETAAS
jgi:phosphocarrier protein HPr